MAEPKPLSWQFEDAAQLYDLALCNPGSKGQKDLKKRLCAGPCSACATRCLSGITPPNWRGNEPCAALGDTAQCLNSCLIILQTRQQQRQINASSTVLRQTCATL